MVDLYPEEEHTMVVLDYLEGLLKSDLRALLEEGDPQNIKEFMIENGFFNEEHQTLIYPN